MSADEIADTHSAIDVQVFIEWTNAAQVHDQERANFLRSRMRDEFKPAFSAWLAKPPGPGGLPSGTPFEEPSYRLKSRARAERFDALSASAVERARQANQNSDNFLFAVVFLASALALGGIAAKFRQLSAQLAVLLLGALMLVVGLVTLVVLPQDLGLSVLPVDGSAANSRIRNAE
jgi:hypothetical protein